MTAPVPSGFPDFGRYQAQAAKVYAIGNFVSSAVAFTVNLGYVGDVPYLGISIFAETTNWVMQLSFFQNADFTGSIIDHWVTLRTGDQFAKTLPVLGPYAQVTFTPVGGAGALDYTFVQAVTTYQPLSFDADDNILFSERAVNHAAGTTALEGSKIWPGEAVLYGILPAAACELRLNSVDATGSARLIAHILGNNIQAERRVFLPATHLQLQFINGGAGPLAFTAVVTAAIGN